MGRRNAVTFSCLLCLLLLVGLAIAGPAMKQLQRGLVSSSECNDTYGTIDNSLNTTAVANRAYITKISTMDCTDNDGDVCAWLYNYNTTDQRVYLMVYDDNGGSGEASTLLDSILVDDTQAGWYQQCEAFVANVSNGDWVGFIAESASTAYYYASSSGGTGRYYDVGSFSVPSPWPNSSDTDSTWDRSIWFDLTD